MASKKNTKGTKASTGNLKRVSIILSDDDELADLENQAPVVALRLQHKSHHFKQRLEKPKKVKNYMIKTLEFKKS